MIIAITWPARPRIIVPGKHHSQLYVHADGLGWHGTQSGAVARHGLRRVKYGAGSSFNVKAGTCMHERTAFVGMLRQQVWLLQL